MKNLILFVFYVIVFSIMCGMVAFAANYRMSCPEALGDNTSGYATLDVERIDEQGRIVCKYVVTTE